MKYFEIMVTVALLAVRSLAAQDTSLQLKQKLKDTAVDARWIYNDLDSGLTEAKKTGKPLLVVFR